MPAILTITDDLLVKAINHASQRVMMIAPGVWPPLADAIATAWRRLGRARVTAILDVDPEICRIGYGSLEGLKILESAASAVGETLGQEPGIRICVVIVDDQTFVFSPSPRQLEPPPGTCSIVGLPQPKANGLLLSRPPEMLESDLGSGPEGITARRLGLDALDQKKLESVIQDLGKNPVKNFDLTHALNVYTAKIQFVELKVAGCRLSEHKATLPKHLLHVVRKNPAISQKIDNSIRLLEAGDDLVINPKLSQGTVFALREAIEKKYLRAIKGIGTVIERSRVGEFSKEVEVLKKEVASFSGRVEANLIDRFQETAEQLSMDLLEEVLTDIPPKWLRQLGSRPDPDQVRWLILGDLRKAFGDPVKKVGSMNVETVFKDVTYDMLKDPAFRIEITKYFPDLPLVEEFGAARDRPKSAQTEFSA